MEYIDDWIDGRIHPFIHPSSYSSIHPSLLPPVHPFIHSSILFIYSSILSSSLKVDPLSYFSFQPLLHDLCNKGHGMCYPVWMVHVKQPLLLIRKSSHVMAAVGFLSHYLSGPLPYVQHHITVFSFQPVLHHWCNKGHGMYYPVCGMMHLKEPLLLIGKSSLCGSSGFPLSLSEWSFTICLMPYNHK